MPAAAAVTNLQRPAAVLTHGVPAGRVFLQSDVKEVATAMYENFREHGSAAFCPDISGAVLSEDTLLAATSHLTDGSSASKSHLENGSAAIDRSQVPQQPHSEQGSASLEGTLPNSSMLHEADTVAGVSRAAMAQEPGESSSAEHLWPPDIQWLPENPLVSVHPSLPRLGASFSPCHRKFPSGAIAGCPYTLTLLCWSCLY